MSKCHMARTAVKTAPPHSRPPPLPPLFFPHTLGRRDSLYQHVEDDLASRRRRNAVKMLLCKIFLQLRAEERCRKFRGRWRKERARRPASRSHSQLICGGTVLILFAILSERVLICLRIVTYTVYSEYDHICIYLHMLRILEENNESLRNYFTAT